MDIVEQRQPHKLSLGSHAVRSYHGLSRSLDTGTPSECFPLLLLLNFCYLHHNFLGMMENIFILIFFFLLPFPFLFPSLSLLTSSLPITLSLAPHVVSFGESSPVLMSGLYSHAPDKAGMWNFLGITAKGLVIASKFSSLSLDTQAGSAPDQAQRRETSNMKIEWLRTVLTDRALIQRPFHLNLNSCFESKVLHKATNKPSKLQKRIHSSFGSYF